MYVELERSGDLSSGDLVKECVSITSLEVGGVPVAADYRVEVRLGAERLGVIRASPFLLDYLATGLALLRGVIKCGGYVSSKWIERRGVADIVVYGSIVRSKGDHCLKQPERLSLSLLTAIYRDFSKRLPKRNCPIAVHRLGLYILGDNSFIFIFFTADPSRHAAAYKLAGMISANASQLPNAPGIVVSTGRLSDDMVRALARAGVRVIVSFHHPLLSGVLEARKQRVTLVLQDPYTSRLRAYSHYVPVDQ